MGDATVKRRQQQRELVALLLLALVFAPLVTVLLVAGYGLLVWMCQIVIAPPTT